LALTGSDFAIKTKKSINTILRFIRYLKQNNILIQETREKISEQIKTSQNILNNIMQDSLFHFIFDKKLKSMIFESFVIQHHIINFFNYSVSLEIFFTNYNKWLFANTMLESTIQSYDFLNREFKDVDLYFDPVAIPSVKQTINEHFKHDRTLSDQNLLTIELELSSLSLTKKFKVPRLGHIEDLKLLLKQLIRLQVNILKSVK
jgi:hypothetical protein